MNSTNPEKPTCSDSSESESMSKDPIPTDQAMEIEQDFASVVRQYSENAIGNALLHVLQAFSTEWLVNSVVNVYRISNHAQKTETLNALVQAVGIKAFLAASDESTAQYLNDSSFVFQEHQASQIIPAQVGKIVHVLGSHHSAVLKALAKVYARNTLLMNELGLDAVSKLIEEINQLSTQTKSTDH